MATRYEVDDDPIVRDIRRIPALRRDDNAELARIVVRGGEEGARARERMISGNMRLVLLLARKYPDGSLTLHDRLQEGTIGLMRAVSKFDPERGISFATYATYWIRAAIERAICCNEHTITVPGNVASAIRRLRKVEAAIDRPLTDGETEEVLHLGRFAVSAVRLLPTSMVPLDAPVSHDDDSTLVVDVIGDDTIEDITDVMLKGDVWHVLDQCPDLSERDRTIVGMFALGESYANIGKAYGLSRERVRQVLSVALPKLRRSLSR